MVFDSRRKKVRGFSTRYQTPRCGSKVRPRGWHSPFLAATAFVFAVDMDISGCYKAHKDKLFGGESPKRIAKAIASEAADLPGRAGLLSR